MATADQTQKSRQQAATREAVEKTDNLVEVAPPDHHAGRKAVVAKFGTVLGMAPGDHPCPVYSCDYKSADKDKYPNRESYIMVVNGVFTGYKWQCVELARRWLLLNKGYVFDSIPMAYDIFNLTTVTRVSDNSQQPVRSFLSGSKRRPEAGCMLIWKNTGEFETTGHVAIVTEVSDTYVRIVEQNVLDEVWAPGTNWSRELTAEITPDGGYRVNENYFESGVILGWVIQTDSDLHAVRHDEIPGHRLRRETRPVPANADRISVEDRSVAHEAAWADVHGTAIAKPGDKELVFFTMPQSAHEELALVSNELEALCKFAVESVIEDDAKLAQFGISQVLWPALRSSWAARRQAICARLDFCLNDRGLKLYGYSADSAACLMECGVVQEKWARAADCVVGSDPGEKLHGNLGQAWKNAKVEGVLHLMQGAGGEETYRTLYMKTAAEAVGIQCKVMKGLAGLNWTADGGIVDQDGTPVSTVWKSWPWDTALPQLCDELEDKACTDCKDQHHPEDARTQSSSAERPKIPPRLSDVLFHPKVRVFEPLWTLIPANKAILPLLWSMFRNHRNLLESEHRLSPALEAKGYVKKTIARRDAAVGKEQKVLERPDGESSTQADIYQELCPLPKLGPDYVQTCCFTAGGRYAGSVLRVDPGHKISVDSPVRCLRVIPDDEWAAAAAAEG